MKHTIKTGEERSVSSSVFGETRYGAFGAVSSRPIFSPAEGKTALTGDCNDKSTHG
jgi:hypothetical protein